MLRVKGLLNPGFAFQVVNVCMPKCGASACSKAALLVWNHMMTLHPHVPVVMCANFDSVKTSSVGKFFLGLGRCDWQLLRRDISDCAHSGGLL